MSQRSKRELLETIRPRDLKTNRSGKKQILDEFVAATGYHRKYAIRVLKHGRKAPGLRKKGWRKESQGEVIVALTRIWEICMRICSKRLKPFLPEIVAVLERHQGLALPAEVKSQLLRMSRSMIDSSLQPARFEEKRHGY